MSSTLHVLQDASGNVIHACATASFPLPQDHWIYQEPVEPALLSAQDRSVLSHYRDDIKAALRYALQACTSRGTATDLDPDAVWLTVQNTLFSDRQEIELHGLDEADSEAYVTYTQQLAKLDQLTESAGVDTQEVDTLMCEMDKSWAKLTPAEKQKIRMGQSKRGL